MSDDFKAWPRYRLRLEKIGLEIRGNHNSSGSDTLRKPERDRPSASADLQAPAPGTHPQPDQVFVSTGVEGEFKASEAKTFVRPPVVVCVTLAHGRLLSCTVSLV